MNLKFNMLIFHILDPLKIYNEQLALYINRDNNIYTIWGYYYLKIRHGWWNYLWYINILKNCMNWKNRKGFTYALAWHLVMDKFAVNTMVTVAFDPWLFVSFTLMNKSCREQAFWHCPRSLYKVRARSHWGQHMLWSLHE